MRPIRTAARALIIHEGQLLAIKMRDRSGIFYILPGGGQRSGETLQHGLERECIEEIGARVEVGELLYIREYIGKNHEFRRHHARFHQLEHVFRCRLLDPADCSLGTELDQKQIGIEWIPLGELKERRFLPEAVKPYFTETGFDCPTTYLGDVN